MVICTDYLALERYHLNYTRIHDKGVLTGEVSRFFEQKDADGDYLHETCCVQMSYAFNNAGPMIQNFGVLPENRIMKDAKGMEYILSVPEMKTYLTRNHFPPEVFPGAGSAQNLASKIGARKGVIAFGDRHIDLWNGRNFQYGGTGLYLENVLWFSKPKERTGPRTISFWEVKTFDAVLQEMYG